MLPREPLAGTTVHTFPGTLGHLPAWFWQYKSMNRLERLSAILILFRLTSEGSLVRTQLRPPSFAARRHFQDANRRPGNHSREPPVHAPGRVLVPRTSPTLRDQAIFVDQTTGASLSPDAALLKIDRFGRRFQRCRCVQGAVRPVLVVVVLVPAQDLLQMVLVPGRRGCRRCSTASWWRRIKISALCHASSRRDSRRHVVTRVMRRKTNCRHMTGDHHERGVGRAPLLVRAEDAILGTHRWPAAAATVRAP